MCKVLRMRERKHSGHPKQAMSERRSGPRAEHLTMLHRNCSIVKCGQDVREVIS